MTINRSTQIRKSISIQLFRATASKIATAFPGLLLIDLLMEEIIVSISFVESGLERANELFWQYGNGFHIYSFKFCR